MLISTICLIGLFLFKEPSIFLMYIGLSIFFSLNLYFFANSGLITSSVAPLSNNTSTVISSCISILSNPIFTVTSLKRSPLSKLHVDILSTTLESITNLLLLLRSNWDPLDLCPYLNYCYCSLSLFFYSYPFFYFCNFSSYVQILYSYNNFCFFSYLYP